MIGNGWPSLFVGNPSFPGCSPLNVTHGDVFKRYSKSRCLGATEVGDTVSYVGGRNSLVGPGECLTRSENAVARPTLTFPRKIPGFDGSMPNTSCRPDNLVLVCGTTSCGIAPAIVVPPELRVSEQAPAHTVHPGVGICLESAGYERVNTRPPIPDLRSPALSRAPAPTIPLWMPLG